MAEMLKRVRRGFKQWLVRSKKYTVRYFNTKLISFEKACATSTLQVIFVRQNASTNVDLGCFNCKA